MVEGERRGVSEAAIVVMVVAGRAVFAIVIVRVAFMRIGTLLIVAAGILKMGAFHGSAEFCREDPSAEAGHHAE